MNDFYKDRVRWDGLKGICKSCCPKYKRKGAREKKDIHKHIDNVECKRCIHCLQFKPLADYGKKSMRWDNLAANCRACYRQNRIKNGYKYVSMNMKPRKKKVQTRSVTNRKKKQNAANTRKRLQNPIHKLVAGMRVRMNAALKNNRKSDHTKVLVGAPMQVVKKWIEEQFLPGMTWDNHTLYGWHIDHKIPIAAWDLSDPMHQQMAFWYKNLQPMWAKQNLQKGHRYTEQDKQEYIQTFLKERLIY